MPRVNQVKSLRELCLGYVANAIESWADQDFQLYEGSDPSLMKLLQQGEDEELFNKCVKPILDILRKITRIVLICLHIH